MTTQTTQNQTAVNENGEILTLTPQAQTAVKVLPPGVVQGVDGKFKRQVTYQAVNTYQVKDRADKVRLVNIMNGSDDSVIPLKSHLKKTIEIEAIMTMPYDIVDEDTGALTNGVTTTLFATDGNVYVTSSKSVYFTLNNIFKVFGLPGTADYEVITVEVYEEKKGNSRNKSVDVKLV